MILLLLFILSLILWYTQEKRVPALVLLYIYMCDGFGIRYIGNVLINSYNVLFLFTNYILFLKRKAIREIIKEDKFAHFIIISYIVLLIHCFVSILLGVENLKYASSVLRHSISFFLLYFFLIDAQLEEIQKSIQIMSILTLLLCLMYPLYFIGINIYNTGEMMYSEEYTRLGIPPAIEFFVIYGIIVFSKKIFTVPYFVPILVGALRGAIMALFMGFFWYFKSQLKHVKFVVLGLIMLLIGYFAYSKFKIDDMQRYDISLSQEVLSAFDSRIILHPEEFYGSAHFNFKDTGTFSFRIAILAERLLYIVSHPVYLLTGVGMIGEDSPNNYFEFFLGTENESSRYGFAQIETNDILWPPYVLRYGLLGIFFWILYFKIIYKRFKSVSSPLATVGSIYTVYLIFHSFGTDMPHRPYCIFIVLLLCVYCHKGGNDEQEEIQEQEYGCIDYNC